MNLLVDRFPVRPSPYHDIVPVRAGYQHCAPSYHFGPELRDSWTIQYVVRGKGTITKNGKSYTAGPNDLFILKPGEEIELLADSTDPWYYIWVGFRAQIPMPTILMEQDLIPGKKLEGLFFEIANCNKRSNRPLEELLISYIWRLIFQLHQMAPTQPAAKTVSESYVERVQRLIHESNAVINVQTIANRLHLNRSHLSRIFREYTGMSIQSYIYNTRFQTAGELLQTHTISQTASILGYGDISSFSRAFKAYFKMSPRQYQNQHDSLMKGIVPENTESEEPT